MLQTERQIEEGFIGQKLIVLPPDVRQNITRNPLIKNFYLTAIGYYPRAGRHGIERKAGCNEYIFIYCIDGSGDITINELSYNLSPNTYIIIPKNVSHRYKSSEKNPWSIYWTHFTGNSAPAIYQRSQENGHPVVHTIPYDENRIREFEEIYYIIEHNYNSREMEILNIKLMHFISSLIYYREMNPALYDKDSVSNSISFMKKNIHAKFTIGQLAAEQRISVSHYARVFKQKTGMSPIHYFNQLKVQKSCQYLYFTDWSIKEICKELGFDDQYYFSRLFTKLMGMSPSGYKRIHKK